MNLTHREFGNLVSVAKLLVYMWPPTSIWTGAFDLVSRATVGMPAEGGGGAGEAELILLMALVPRLSWDRQSNTTMAGSF